MTYQEYMDTRQKEFNALPIFFAFGQEQFEKAMNERGLAADDYDKIYGLKGTGGFYLRSDADLVRAWFNNDKLGELMQNDDFAFDAFYYEMCNHEYGINMQADWDVCSCFGHVDYVDSEDDLQSYFDQLNWSEGTRKAYIKARRKYYRDAEENEWF